MSAFLAALLAVSVLLLAAVLTLRLPRFRGYAGTAALWLALGVCQIVLGALWMLWGVLFFRGNRSGSRAGWYVVVLGGLWMLQGARRLARRSGPPR